MFYLTGIAINFFLVAILAGKKNKSEADKILVLWLIFVGLHLSAFYLFITGQYLTYPLFLGFEIPFPLLHGPFLYLYTSSLTNQTSGSKLRYLHFLPILLAYIPLLSFVFSPVEYKVLIYQNKGAGYEWIMIPMNIAVIISGITYVLLSMIKLYRHRKNITNQFSNTDKINLIWLRYLIIGMSCIWLAVIFGNDKYVFAIAVLYVFFIGYFGIKQTNIFSPDRPLLIEDFKEEKKADDEIENSTLPEPADESTPEKSKYQKSGLNEDELRFIYTRLTELMKQEKLYTNPELTLGDTARHLKIHPNYLSQVINTIENNNFYDFINSRRVEEFKRIVMLPQNQKFTLLSLAFECGFNSKTSFNRNFKKVTGLSPTEYLKQNNVSLSQAS